MRSRVLVLCCVLSMVLATVPAAGSTYQVRGCFGDAPDDVIDLASSDHVDEPRADIAEWCVDYSGDELIVALRAATVTDPVSDPVWQDVAAAVAFVLEGSDGTGVVLNLGVPRGGGAFGYSVLTDSRVPEELCHGPATLIDDVWTAAAPLRDCFGTLGGLPDTLTIASQLFYGLGSGGSTAEGAFDAAPDVGTISVPRVVSPSPGLDRFAGAERVATSIQISMASFADGAAEAVVLARSDVFADAVVAAPLAVRHNAPLLLTGQDTVSEPVLLEIQRALGGIGEVILLGGTAAIRSSVENQLTARGHRVSRIAGANRFDTSVRVARATTDDPSVIFLADGGDFPDALIAGAAAPRFDGVTVLATDGRIPVEVEAYIADHPGAQLYAVGDGAHTAAPDAPAAAGATPYLTSALLAQVFNDPAEVVIANGERFPDGLTGGAYAARRGAPLLLSPRDALDTSVLQYLEGAGPFDAIAVLGGTAAMSDTVAGQVSDFLR